MVNVLIPIVLVALLIVFFGFKMNNIRTKMAFFFILFGVLFIIFIVFLVTSGESVDFSSIGSFFSSVRVYFVWIKEAVVGVFEFTGRIIGLDIGKNATEIIR